MDNYLCRFQYGYSAAWLYVRAGSEAAITERCPALQIVRDRPSWLNDERREGLLEAVEDLDQPGFALGPIIEGRQFFEERFPNRAGEVSAEEWIHAGEVSSEQG